MRNTVLTCALVLSLFASGQSRNIYFPRHADGDTGIWYVYQHELIDDIGMDNVENGPYRWQLRFSNGRQIIDVWESLEGRKQGHITSWTREYPTERLYAETLKLDSQQVVSLISLTDMSGVRLIPDQKNISGWHSGLDGMTYFIETADSIDYNFKTYWSPHGFSIPEAKIIQAFADSAERICNADTVWAYFTQTVPFISFTNSGGAFVTLKALTKKEKRELKRERRKYLRNRK